MHHRSWKGVRTSPTNPTCVRACIYRYLGAYCTISSKTFVSSSSLVCEKVWCVVQQWRWWLEHSLSYWFRSSKVSTLVLRMIITICTVVFWWKYLWTCVEICRFLYVCVISDTHKCTVFIPYFCWICSPLTSVFFPLTCDVHVTSMWLETSAAMQPVPSSPKKSSAILGRNSKEGAQRQPFVSSIYACGRPCVFNILHCIFTFFIISTMIIDYQLRWLHHHALLMMYVIL